MLNMCYLFDAILLRVQICATDATIEIGHAKNQHINYNDKSDKFTTQTDLSYFFQYVIYEEKRRGLPSF